MPIMDRARVAAALPGYDLGRELGAGAFGLVLAARRTSAAPPGSAASGDVPAGLPRPALDEDIRDVAVRILDLELPAGTGPAAGPDPATAHLGTAHPGTAHPTAGQPPAPPAEADPASDARILTRLAHPHLCRLLDIVLADGLRLLVSELLPGGTLARQSLTPPAACAVAVAVADGLMHAHAAGVLHRDVKPANILFTADGRPVLTDVGVVGLVDGTPLATGRIVGTAQYMAPEQITGGRLVPATDVYALAATLYELLTGAPPFGAGLTVPELFLHHCEVPAPPAAGVAPPVAAVLARALAKDPGQRHRGAGQFAVDLGLAAQAAYGPDWMDHADVRLLVSTGLRGSRPADGLDRASPAPASQIPAEPDPAQRTTRLGTGPHPLGAAPPAVALVAPGGDPAGPPPGVGDSPARGPRGSGPAPSADAVAMAGRGDSGAAGSGADIDGDLRGQSWTRRVAILTAAAVTVAGVAAALTIPLSERGGQTVVEATATRPPSGPGTAAPAAPDPPLPSPPPYAVTTVAGTGTAGYGGDGGPAAAASVNAPFGLVADRAGNVYVADSGNNRVRRIAPDGTIVTVAGTGVKGFAGDGGPAVDAQLYQPSAVTLDRDGGLLIADTFNQRIRRVDAAGIITTVAGNGEHSFSGDGGPATAAALWYPGGVAVDGNGTVFIADTANNRIRRVGSDGIITTLAGQDGEGSFGDGGPASRALLAFPLAVALDRFGRLYIADTSNNRIRRIGLDGRIETVAGNGRPGLSGDGGPATKATLRSPRGVTVDAAGTIYITDRTNRRVRRVDAAGVITTVAGTARPGRVEGVDPAALSPDGQVALDPSGDLVVSDRRRNLVLRVDLTGAG
ncbi:serine/threonine protein kinase [Frankia sp. R43]|nr:serine/threonine protein kinase [Frankia sp. R43]